MSRRWIDRTVTLDDLLRLRRAYHAAVADPSCFAATDALEALIHGLIVFWAGRGQAAVADRWLAEVLLRDEQT